MYHTSMRQFERRKRRHEYGEVEDVNHKHYRRRMASDLVSTQPASKETKDSLGSTLVDCAKQIVGLHMSGRIEAEVNYTDGILNIMDSTNWKEE